HDDSQYQCEYFFHCDFLLISEHLPQKALEQGLFGRLAGRNLHHAQRKSGVKAGVNATILGHFAARKECKSQGKNGQKRREMPAGSRGGRERL
ncbi:MAG: hypothetical protein ACI4JU_05685, partial [Angelakisella sp.]